MRIAKPRSGPASSLRSRAEQRLSVSRCDVAAMSAEEVEALVHELQVHQVELEVQNQDLRETQLEIEASRSAYVDLYEFAPVGYVTLDRHGAIVEANLTACMLLGVERDKLISRKLSQFVRASDQDTLFRHYRNVFGAEGKYSCEVQLDKPDDRPLYVRLQSVAMDAGEGGERHCRSCFVDITERKQLEEELQRLNLDLEHRVAERTEDLERALREIESLNNSVAQPLRAPLRAVRGFSQIVLEDYAGVLDAQGKDYLKRVNLAALQTEDMIEALIQLARVAQRRELHPVKVYLSGLACEIAEELRARDRERQVSFMVSPDLTTTGDASMLRTVLKDLLDNAWKFTRKCPQARIEFDATDGEGDRVYRVRDNGVGFDMAYADKLFQPFMRLHNPDEFEGVGIGLAIAQRCIQKHRGRVWAEAAVNQGASFYFTLGSPAPMQ